MKTYNLREEKLEKLLEDILGHFDQMPSGNDQISTEAILMPKSAHSYEIDDDLQVHLDDAREFLYGSYDSYGEEPNYEESD